MPMPALHARRCDQQRQLPPVPSVVDAAFAAAGHANVEATGGWLAERAKSAMKMAKEGSKKALLKTKEAAEAAVEMAKDGTEVVAEGTKKVAKGAASKTKSAGKALLDATA